MTIVADAMYGRGTTDDKVSICRLIGLGSG
jgi:acetylornithine deacetylase/succinyl-diaminopimelate desuccinylase-like protein